MAFIVTLLGEKLTSIIQTFVFLEKPRKVCRRTFFLKKAFCKGRNINDQDDFEHPLSVAFFFIIIRIYTFFIFHEHLEEGSKHFYAEALILYEAQTLYY